MPSLLPAAAAAAAPAVQPRLSFPYELHDPVRGCKGTYHDHRKPAEHSWSGSQAAQQSRTRAFSLCAERLKAQFAERLKRRPRHRRPPGPQLPGRDSHDHRHDSGWSQDLEADIAAICCEAGLTAATATTVLAAAQRGLVSANPGILLAQVGRLLGWCQLPSNWLPAMCTAAVVTLDGPWLQQVAMRTSAAAAQDRHLSPPSCCFHPAIHVGTTC